MRHLLSVVFKEKIERTRSKFWGSEPLEAGKIDGVYHTPIGIWWGVNVLFFLVLESRKVESHIRESDF